MWSQLGMNQRVSVVLAGLAVVAGLAATMWFSSRTDYALLYGNLSDTEAAKVVAVLDDNKVAYKPSGGSIYVPSNKVHLMRMKMAEKNIPRTSTGVGYELFDKPNFGISDFIQQKNWSGPSASLTRSRTHASWSSCPSLASSRITPRSQPPPYF